ncbi:nucleotidyltransferase domain-containing protein [Limnochorda pilosa]|uniref:Polymerase nucleotidyl transferase domain-containing protein n=1 Tax=Limnochorda pilosa TaxID=1555112 RepID=A0A0K2SM60_LIMPI|nr:nucleotidyltransferase domain-containing protein [Limnochorda pilosa]BAS28190.1 hypothetical protein LIP_2349 [Limnochorda pilosa]
MDRQPWKERLEHALEQAVAQIVSAYDPDRIILFGSVARGDVHEDQSPHEAFGLEDADDAIRHAGNVLASVKAAMASEHAESTSEHTTAEETPTETTPREEEGATSPEHQ